MKLRTELGAANRRHIAVAGVWWSSLAKGERVEVDCGDVVIHRGVVDDVTDDGSVVWLWLDEGRGRAFYLQSDGHSIYRCSPTDSLACCTAG